jgi:putative membrane protein
MGVLAKLVLQALAVYLAAYLIPGITVSDALAALAVAVVLGVANSFIRPLLQLVAFPLTIFTFGLFALVINGLIVYLVAWLVPGFVVSSLLSAVIFSLALSIISTFLNSLT